MIVIVAKSFKKGLYMFEEEESMYDWIADFCEEYEDCGTSKHDIYYRMHEEFEFYERSLGFKMFSFRPSWSLISDEILQID